MTVAGTLPHVTAFFNALSLACLLVGYVHIRAGRRDAHRKAMLGAAGASALFLVFYLIYHFFAPVFEFRGVGAIRPLYYTLLISHVVLAAVAVPPIALTLLHALRGDFERHRPMARRTLPLWLYVSVTGLVVYLMLYHIYS